MFTIKTVRKFLNTKQQMETVVETSEYEIRKFGHGTIEVSYIPTGCKEQVTIHLSKVWNRRNDVKSEKVFIANSAGVTVDKVSPTDTFDAKMTKDEWAIEDSRLKDLGK